MRSNSARGFIRTVTGDVSPAQWGVTNTHAHLSVNTGAHHYDPRYVDFKFTVADTLPEMHSYADAGGYAIVDLTPMGMGRDPIGAKTLSEETGVLVIFGTGIYHEAFHPKELEGLGPTAICDLLIAEITEGIAGTDIKAGIIGEQGTYQSAISPREGDVLRASVWAAKETGAALSTHTHAGELALEQLDLLLAEGLPANQIVIGHLDDRAPLDVGLQLEVARRGAWVQYDDIGYEYFTETLNVQMPTDIDRVYGILQLIEAGYADQIVLGSDLARTRHLRSNGGPGLAHLAGDFSDLALRHGWTREVLQQLFVDNPAKMLTLR